MKVFDPSAFVASLTREPAPLHAAGRQKNHLKQGELSLSVPPEDILSGAQTRNTAPLRLFIGIACPCTPLIAELIDNLRNESQAAADDLAVGLRVVSPHNLHITLKFIGATAATALPDIIRAMQEAIAGHHAFTLQLRGAGRFQSALWLGVAPNAALSALASALNAALAPLGFAPETKPYRPHLTLARLTPKLHHLGAGQPATSAASQMQPTPAFALEPWLTQHQNSHWGTLPVAAVHLYRSDTLPAGVRYTVLSTVPLRPPAA